MQRFLIPARTSAQEFLPLLTHDLRQPVTSIKGFSQLALRQPEGSPRINHLLTTILDEVNHLATLMEDLALVSRIERGMLPVQVGAVNLSSLVTDTVGTLTSRHYEGELATNSDRSELEAHCDSAVTQRALANVIRYSLKFGQRDRPMHVAPIGDRRRSAIWISADGADPANQPDLPLVETTADPLETPAEFLPVNDLSLYIATRLVELQGGQIWGEDRVREGAGFLVLLPPGEFVAALETMPKGRR